jgi:hypothetical protein
MNKDAVVIHASKVMRTKKSLLMGGRGPQTRSLDSCPSSYRWMHAYVATTETQRIFKCFLCEKIIPRLDRHNKILRGLRFPLFQNIHSLATD